MSDDEKKELLRRMDDERIAKLEERLAGFVTRTDEYRVERDGRDAEYKRALCAKIDKLFDRLNALPCDASQKDKESLHKEVDSLWNVVWRIIWTVVPCLLIFGIAWGTLGTTVLRNTNLIFAQGSQLDTNTSDIVALKARSFGYKGVKVATEDDLKELEAKWQKDTKDSKKIA